MNIVDIVIILIIALCTFLGFKKGVIKSLVQLIGTAAVLILAYSFKGILANFLMSFMPFFNFIGYEGITAINILIYEMLSFIVIFVLLYCILNILLSLSGLIETLLKVTVILALPSKILGALVGFLEGVILAFMITFILLHAGPVEKFVMESQTGIILLERTPFIGQVMLKTTESLKDINELVNEMKADSNKDAVNAQVLQILIHYQVITKEDAKRIIEEKIPELENVTFA